MGHICRDSWDWKQPSEATDDLHSTRETWYESWVYNGQKPESGVTEMGVPPRIEIGCRFPLDKEVGDSLSSC